MQLGVVGGERERVGLGTEDCNLKDGQNRPLVLGHLSARASIPILNKRSEIEY